MKDLTGNNIVHNAASLSRLPYRDLTTEELAEVYLYAVLTFGRNNVKTILVRDAINDRVVYQTAYDDGFSVGYSEADDEEYKHGYADGLIDAKYSER